MSYAYYANDHESMPDVETVAVSPLDARGEPKGERIEGVRALFHEDVTEGINGTPIGVTGTVARVTVFISTLPVGTTLAALAKIHRQDGYSWTILDCGKRVYGTRYVCDCRRETPRA